MGRAFNFWRSTDNDDNTWGDQKLAIRWREVGLDRLTVEDVGILLEENDENEPVTLKTLTQLAGVVDRGGDCRSELARTSQPVTRLINLCG